MRGGLVALLAPRMRRRASGWGRRRPKPAVNYSGLVGQEYQAQAQQRAAMLGGLAGAASTALGGWAFGRFPGSERIVGALGGGTQPQLRTT